MSIIPAREEKFFYTPSVKNTDAINIWFAFPANYNIAMSSLGYLHLFSLLDRNPNVNVERFFYDTTKTKFAADNLDLISFSFSFEFDFLAVFEMLEKNHIPIRYKDRDDTAPLVMGGGAVLTANPEPFADIFDFILIGDGEDLIIEVTDILYAYRNKTKRFKLEKLAEISGVYVPEFQDFANITRRILSSKQCISSTIVTPHTTFSDSFLIEVTRGCPFKCNFCLTSHINNPPHYAALDNLKAAVDVGITNCSSIGLLGALVPSNPSFEPLCEYIIEKREQKEFKVAIGSLRADFITPLNIKMLTSGGQKTATIAIEAGSQRMRDFINKKLTEDQILKAVDICYENGLDGLKLYAMVGFPTEIEDDIFQLMTLVKNIKQKKKLTLAINSFVPKKQTPFENMPMEKSKSLEKKFLYLKKECAKNGIAFRPCSIAWNEIQGIISIGEKKLFDYLYSAYKDGATIGAFRKNFRKIN